MKMKWFALICVLALMLGLTGCGEEEVTTRTGLVVAVDGTVISFQEMDSSMEGMNFDASGRPSMPSDMEGFEGFDAEGFFGEGFEGTFPEGEGMPQWGEGGEMPDGFTVPEGGTMPQMPEGGERPDFSGDMGGMMAGFGGFGSDAEAETIDIGDAHISVEIEGGKATGSLEDIVSGAFVTITTNSKGKVTNVLVSSMSGFGGFWEMQ